MSSGSVCDAAGLSAFAPGFGAFCAHNPDEKISAAARVSGSITQYFFMRWKPSYHSGQNKLIQSTQRCWFLGG